VSWDTSGYKPTVKKVDETSQILTRAGNISVKNCSFGLPPDLIIYTRYNVQKSHLTQYYAP
jgi:hypothetical protein